MKAIDNLYYALAAANAALGAAEYEIERFNEAADAQLTAIANAAGRDSDLYTIAISCVNRKQGILDRQLAAIENAAAAIHKALDVIEE